MIESTINSLVSMSILLLYNKMLSSYKIVTMVLEMKFQDKTKSKRCNCAMQKNDSRKALTTIIQEKAPVLEHVHCNMGIFSRSQFLGLRVRIQGLGSQDLRVPGLKVSAPRSRVSGSRVPGLRSQVLILDYVLICLFHMSEGNVT